MYKNIDYTLIDVFENTCKKYNNDTCMNYFTDDNYTNYDNITWNEYNHKTKILFNYLSQYLINNENTNIAIYGIGTPEWYIANMASLFLGRKFVSIHKKFNGIQLENIIESTNSSIIIVDDNLRMNNLLNLNNTNNIKCIIKYSEKIDDDVIKQFNIKNPDINVIEWNTIFDNDEHTNDFENNNKISPNDVCSIIYSSSFDNNPKGVELTHKSIIWTMLMLLEELDINDNTNTLLNYMPLNNIMVQLLDVHLQIFTGSDIWFGGKNIDTNFVKVMKIVKPTIFVGIPKIWKDIKLGIESKIQKSNRIKKMFFNGMKNISRINNMFISKKIKKELGLTDCKLFFSGSSYLEPELVSFFKTFDINIFNIYGMCETCGLVSLETQKNNKIGSVGKILNGIDVVIKSDTSEILIKSPNIMKKYVDRNSDDNFYKHYYKTGDIGTITNGYLYIYGKLNNIIVNGNDTINPIFVENYFKRSIPILSHVVLISKNNILTLLLNIKKRNKYVDDYLLSNNINVDSRKDLSNDKNFVILIKKSLNIYNNRISKTTKIESYCLITKEFKIGKELNQVFELNRNYINEKYSDIINDMYKKIENLND